SAADQRGRRSSTDGAEPRRRPSGRAGAAPGRQTRVPARRDEHRRRQRWQLYRRPGRAHARRPRTRWRRRPRRHRAPAGRELVAAHPAPAPDDRRAVGADGARTACGTVDDGPLRPVVAHRLLSFSPADRRVDVRPVTEGRLLERYSVYWYRVKGSCPYLAVNQRQTPRSCGFRLERAGGPAVLATPEPGEHRTQRPPPPPACTLCEFR